MTNTKSFSQTPSHAVQKTLERCAEAVLELQAQQTSAGLANNKSHFSILSIWLYGSQATSQTHDESDIDLAFIATRPLIPKERFYLAQELALKLHNEVALVDLRTVTPDLGARIVAEDGLRHDLVPSKAAVSDAFEVTLMSQYVNLNEERKGILEDIMLRKGVYER